MKLAVRSKSTILTIFWLKYFELMSQTSNVHFNGGKNMNMFSIVNFFAKQIFKIVENQIEMEVIFSLTRILTSFNKCRL